VIQTAVIIMIIMIITITSQPVINRNRKKFVCFKRKKYLIIKLNLQFE